MGEELDVMFNVSTMVDVRKGCETCAQQLRTGKAKARSIPEKSMEVACANK